MSLTLPADQIHRYTVDEYEALAGNLAFEGKRVELIDGLILDKSPKSPEHENAVQWLTGWLYDRIDRGRWEIGVGRRCGSATPSPSRTSA